MRIFAYVASGCLGVLGWAAVLVALLAVSPWLALGWVVALAVALAAYAATSPTYLGYHGRRGPRARCTGRRAPSEPDPTLRPHDW